jgi:DNA-binding HxlR family transcriptional regulator
MEKETQTYHCPVEKTIELIGGKYKSLILWHLIGSVRRFGELRKLIPQATPKMLTQQLRELEEAGLVVRTVYPVVPPKVEYALSVRGSSIRPILEAMYSWGSAYLQGEGKTVCCSMQALSEASVPPKTEEEVSAIVAPSEVPRQLQRPLTPVFFE